MIPRNKIIDPRFGKKKAFEDMKHNSHSNNPNRLEQIECTRCTFDIREKSMDDKIKSMNGNETTKSNGLTLTFKDIKIIRGKYDDVIGWTLIWL